jgi:ribosomal protein S18 acetylase RimI-like enzyme
MEEVIVTRIAGEDDVPIIGSILCDSWKHAYRGLVEDRYLDTLSSDRWTDFLTEGFANNKLNCLLILVDGLPAGAAVVRRSEINFYPDDAEMVCLYLLPAYIGRGIGTVLLKKMEQILIEMNYTHCVLDVISANRQAVRFYEHKGFIKTGAPVGVTLDGQILSCDIMRKTL